MPEEPKQPTGTLSIAVSLAVKMANFCEAMIAGEGYVVRLPPDPWAGRDEVIAACMSEFKASGVTVFDAGRAVDAAIVGMWHERKDDPKIFLKTGMRMRLNQLRQIIMAGIKEGKSEMTYKYTPYSDMTTEQLPPKIRLAIERGETVDMSKTFKQEAKEKVNLGLDTGSVMLLLQIEKCLSELDGLSGSDDNSASSMVNVIFNTLDEVASQQSKQKEKEGLQSRALAAKQRTLGDMTSEQDQAILGKILGTATPVPSVTVVPGKRGRGRPRSNPIVAQDAPVESMAEAKDPWEEGEDDAGD